MSFDMDDNVKKLIEKRNQLLKDYPYLIEYQEKLDRMMARLPDVKSRMLLYFNLLNEKTTEFNGALKEFTDLITKALEKK